MAVPILLFYALGAAFFVIGLEEDLINISRPFIYLGISFFINLIGYYNSYSDTDYTGSAYFPLVLMILSILIMLYNGFGILKNQFNDDYAKEDDAKSDS